MKSIFQWHDMCCAHFSHNLEWTFICTQDKLHWFHQTESEFQNPPSSPSLPAQITTRLSSELLLRFPSAAAAAETQPTLLSPAPAVLLVAVESHHSRLLVDQESPSAPQQVTRLWLPETLASHSYVISMYYCEKCNGDNTHVSPVCNPSITMHNTYCVCEGPDGRSRVTQNIRTEGVGARREICLQ